MAANKAACRLVLGNGVDLTDRVNPRLIDLTLTEKRGEAADQLDLTIHNHDGQLAPPKVGAILKLALGWESGADVLPGMVDKGSFRVDEVERSGPPDVITIRARSADLTGDFRTRRTRSWIDTNLGAIVQTIAGENGFSSRITGDLASIAVKAIEQAGKSDMAFLRDLGRRYDAVATVKNETVIFMPLGSSTTPGGKALPALRLTKVDGWSWTFRHEERTGADGASAEYHDQDAGQRKTVTTGGSKPKKLKKVYASKADAEKAAKSAADKAKRSAYSFTYDLAFGDPAITPNMPVQLQGWDSEIDGMKWLVGEVTTRFGAGGLVTAIKLESAA
jgi:uncharacterized protein